MDHKFKLYLIPSAMAGVLFASLGVPVANAGETTVYVEGTIPLDKGKPRGSAGVSHTETNGKGTTKVDVNTDGKNLNGKVSHTPSVRGRSR